jgi:hypothetical protein
LWQSRNGCDNITVALGIRDILTQDPAFVAETFFVIKPLLIWRAQEIMYQSLFAGLDPWHSLVLLTSLSILASVVARDARCFRLLYRGAAVALVCALLACLPNWLVLANELVMFDSFIWELFLLSLTSVVLVALLSRSAFIALQGLRRALMIPVGERDMAVAPRDG